MYHVFQSRKLSNIYGLLAEFFKETRQLGEAYLLNSPVFQVKKWRPREDSDLFTVGKWQEQEVVILATCACLLVLSTMLFVLDQLPPEMRNG